MADRINIEQEQRKLIDELKNSKMLNIKILGNSELFLLAVAFGFDNPKDLKSKDGYVLFSTLNDKFKSMVSSINLAKCETSDDIEHSSNLERNIEMAEKHAKTGFEELSQLFSEDDEELLFKRMLHKVDMLYKVNIDEFK